jgi:hypothetical protein
MTSALNSQEEHRPANSGDRIQASLDNTSSGLNTLQMYAVNEKHTYVACAISLANLMAAIGSVYLCGVPVQTSCAFEVIVRKKN